MKFNPDIDFATHRDAEGGRWYLQNGHKFTVSGIHLGPVDGKSDKPDAAEPKKSKPENKAIRERAAKKLEGFKTPEQTGSIAQALNENQAAAAAEEHAE